MSNIDTDSLMEQAIIPLPEEMRVCAVKFVHDKAAPNVDEILEMLGLNDEVEQLQD